MQGEGEEGEEGEMKCKRDVRFIQIGTTQQQQTRN
jgi:hypothetical protein